MTNPYPDPVPPAPPRADARAAGAAAGAAASAARSRPARPRAGPDPEAARTAPHPLPGALTPAGRVTTGGQPQCGRAHAVGGRIGAGPSVVLPGDAR